MVKKPGKLKDALNRFKGKDLAKEHKLKVLKQNEKKSSAKRALREQVEDEAIEGVADDIELEAGVALNGDHGDDDWEDEDTDDEAKAGFDMSRLEFSDSDSSDDDDASGDASTRQVKAALAALKKSGIPAVAKKTNSSSTIKPLKSALKSTVAADAITVGEDVADAAEEDEDVEADDAEDDVSDIPLSDIASDTEDIVPHRRLTINNTVALTRALQSFALPLSTIPFSTHQSLTTSAPVSIPDIDDDLNRELAFYAQSLSAVTEARKLLKSEGVPFTRPTDYFAEMVKSDEHMGKVKGKLVDEAAGKKAAAEARRQRDLKKFGKQVQQEKLKERAQEKKQMLDRVNVLKRKRQGADESGSTGDGMFDVELEDAMESKGKDGRDSKRRRGTEAGGRGGSRAGGRPGRSEGQSNPKRARKDEKFGFGGKKRFAKSGDAQSSGDMSGFSTKRMKGQTKGGGAKRPGKARRAKMR